MWIRRWLVVAALAGCGSVQVEGSRVRTVTQAASGKRVAVYRSSEFRDTEPREVPEDVVVQAMNASSMFFEEDIRALASDIATTLGQLHVEERVVVETSDTAIHMYVKNGELQIASFRDGQEVSRHASAIPATAIKTTLTPKHPTQATTAPAPPPQPVVVTPPPPVVVTPPPPQPIAVAPPPPPPVLTPPEHLSEAEIRKRLAELDHLLAKHLITQPEYEQKRKALVDQL